MKPKKNWGHGLLFHVLKGMAVSFIPLCILPLLAIINLTLRGGIFDWPQMGSALVGAFVSALGGVLTGWAVCLYDRKSDALAGISAILHLMIHISAVIVCLCFSSLLWPINAENGDTIIRSGMHLALTTGVLAAGWIMTAKSMPERYTAIFSLQRFLQYTMVYIAVLLFIPALNRVFPVRFNIATLSLPFGVMALFSVILMNQGNLDGMMERRQHSKELLPEKIRVYNLLMISGLLLLMTLGLAFGEGFFAAAIRSGKKLLLAGLYGILDFLGIPEGQAVQRDWGQTDPRFGAGTPNSYILRFLAQKARTNPWWNLLFLLLALILAYVLYSNWRAILSHFRERMIEIGSAFWDFLMGRFHFREIGVEKGDYTDKVEELLHEDNQLGSAVFRRSREMKRVVKEWRRTDDPVKKIRDGYRLLIVLAKTSGSDIVFSDTVSQILEKNRETLLGSAFERVNPIYNRVRYGEMMPSAAETAAVGREIERVFESGGVAMKNLAGQMEREKKVAKEAAKNVRKK